MEMTISEAMAAASRDYDAEVEKAHADQTFGALMGDVICTECAELDQELAKYVADILSAQKWPPGILDPRVFILARMCFRFGMRTQRKMDRPDQPTSIFWRSDRVKV